MSSLVPAKPVTSPKSEFQPIVIKQSVEKKSFCVIIAKIVGWVQEVWQKFTSLFAAKGISKREVVVSSSKSDVVAESRTSITPKETTKEQKYQKASFDLDPRSGRILTRAYYDKEGKLISSDAAGKQTGSMVEFLSVVKRNSDLHEKMLKTVKLYCDLPTKFVGAFTKYQLSEKSFRNVPGIFHGYLKVHTKMVGIFGNTGTDFSLDKWRELGFKDEDSYREKFDLSVAEFFAGRVHVCNVKMRFGCVGKKDGIDQFKSLLPPGKITSESIENLPEVPIFSTPGLELRPWHYSDPRAKDPSLQITKQEASDLVKTTYSKIIFNLLSSAERENMDELNLIPIGLGVFLGGFSREDKRALTFEILDQYAAGIDRFYENDTSACLKKIRFFGAPHIKRYLQTKLNPKTQLFFELGDGDALQDALVRIQDGSRVAFAGAPDGDWVYQIKKDKEPGECWKAHTLFHSTADEMVALFSQFSMMGNKDLNDHNLLEKSIIVL